ncbi:MAG: zinc ribbon domain-containing protein [Parcubacteria group bacterium]|jgi:hypothetical protein
MPGFILLFIVVMVVVILGAARLIWEVFTRPGFICANGHWQATASKFCKTCGQPVKSYNDPRCPNGHKMGEAEDFCSQCGEKIALKENEKPAPEQFKPEEEPKKEELRQKHKTRNLVLIWALVFICFGSMVWGATYFLQVAPLKKILQESAQYCKRIEDRLEREEERRRSLENAKFSRSQAKDISKEKATWKITKWHIDKKGQGGTIWIKKVGQSGRFEREEEIPVGTHGIENWSDALRWPGNIMIDFDYHDDWKETGDYLRPKLAKKK